jgi:hypothetical protein
MSALAWFAVLLLVITSVGLLLARDWRWLIIYLSAQYFGMLILTLQHWPLGLASVKVVAGWMSAAILGMTRSGLPRETGPEGQTCCRADGYSACCGGHGAPDRFLPHPRVDVIMADAAFRSRLEAAAGGNGVVAAFQPHPA